MIKMRMQILLFAFMCVMRIFASSENELQREKRLSEQVTAKNLMKVYEKIDSLNERLEKLEANSSTVNNGLDDDKNKINITQILLTNEQLTKKFDKHEKHLNKIEELLFQLLERNELKMNESRTRIVNEVTSQCTSMCESKVNIWENETNHQFKENLEKLDFCIKDDRKALNVCDSNPCLHGGICEVTATGNDFRCTHCPFPTSGKRCDNLNCGSNKCVQRMGTVYVLFEEGGTWEEADRKCISNGMTLAMPKDKDCTEFLVNYLRPIFELKAIKGVFVHFWLGLKYDEGGQQWRWLD